jgi:uncharacterized protein with FMN-binding domain
MTVASRSNALALFAAIAVVAPLAGCAADATAAGGSAGGSAGGATSGTYTDGTYSEEGSYQSPNGLESVEVTLTLADNTVTDVEVVGNGTNPNTKQFQGLFISGIAGEVVGKNIDELSVDKVAGSSLTSGGFNDAVSKIKADAAE